MEVKITDSVASVQHLLVKLEKCSRPILLFVDLEGVNLSRHGSIAILQLYIPSLDCVYLVDIHTLKQEAFDITIAAGLSLKSILQSTEYIKVIFDVRNDSDALFGHFEVDLQGVVDLQLLEFATRPSRGRFVKGLAKCIEESYELSYADRIAWRRTKDAGTRLFAPELGGRYEVFHERPLPQCIIDYCAQDVTVMPKLLIAYSRRLQSNLASQVQSETLARIALSQSPSFRGKGRHMAVGPAFSWHRATVPVDHPMSIICSEALVEICAPRTQVLVEQDSVPDPVVVTERTNTAAVASEQVSSIEEALSSLVIDDQSPTPPSPQ